MTKSKNICPNQINFGTQFHWDKSLNMGIAPRYYAYAVKYRYNAVYIIHVTQVDVPWLTCKGGTWGVGCESLIDQYM